ncbi:MAG: bifunctional biotin--[acetyl-CoA-carboxylase] synthetase/biotin operon repressor, partial [Pseudomonadota bacterium]|nr:bifunctional biotin--[acetyl-CoA-carboxylase] synthetase/biotin operon repressor [Pseudomonadota bacterium]
QPWTDVRKITNIQPDRNRLIAAILDNLYSALNEFTEHGFAKFAVRWPQYDMLANESITLSYPNKKIQGMARGIGNHGELLIESEGIIQAHLNGTVRKTKQL